jgi:hypothetical protein
MDKTGLIEGVVREWARRGWTAAALPDGTGWQLAQDARVLYINANRHWLYLTLPVVGESPSDAGGYGALLRLCHRCFMTKYSLGDGSQVLLQVEIPLDHLSRHDCHKAFEATTVYAERHGSVMARRRISATVERAWGDPIVESAERETEIFSLEALGRFFSTVEHQGWGVRDRPGLNRWKAVYKGHERSFDVYLSFDRSWAYFQAPLLGDTCTLGSPSNACQAVFYPYLLKLNEQMYWAKIGLDEDGQVLLLLEMPLEMFDLPRFRRAVQTLATYADAYAYDIQIMANLDQDRRLVTLLSKQDA